MSDENSHGGRFVSMARRYRQRGDYDQAKNGRWRGKSRCASMGLSLTCQWAIVTDVEVNGVYKQRL